MCEERLCIVRIKTTARPGGPQQKAHSEGENAARHVYNCFNSQACAAAPAPHPGSAQQGGARKPDAGHMRDDEVAVSRRVRQLPDAVVEILMLYIER